MAKFPQSFGPYTLQELIARGGMAEVYRATLPGVGGFEKTVAIKKILPHLAENAEFVVMLIDEARIIVSLNHANIAQVYDLGMIGDTYYIAMEYIHGVDLSGILKELSKVGAYMDYAHVAYIASGICAGLHVAHSATENGRRLEIVHRDVSPHNVLISFAGDVKIIDFGVAKAQGKETHTQMGVIKGKLLYMAPEQAMAKPVDGRADLFSAGLILYNMLTNTLPFDGDNEFQIYNNILSKNIVPPKALNPGVPEELNQITMRLLQRDPANRYQDGYSAKVDLDRALHNLSPGYNVSRLSMWVEDNFTHLLQKNKKKAKPPNFESPRTPSFNGVNTAQTVEAPALGGGQGPTVEAPAFVPIGTVPPTIKFPAPSLNGEVATVEVTPLDIAGLVRPNGQAGSATVQPFGPAEAIPAGFGTGQHNAIKDGMRAKADAAGTGEFGVAPQPKSALAPILAILAVLALMGAMVGYQIYMSDSAHLEVEPVVDVNADPSVVPKDSIALLVGAGAADTGPDTGQDVGVADSSMVELGSAEIRIDVDPPEAEVFVEGQMVGTSPAIFAVDASEEALEVEVKLDGFETQSLKIVPDASKTERVKLKRIEAETKPSEPSKPSKATKLKTKAKDTGSDFLMVAPKETKKGPAKKSKKEPAKKSKKEPAKKSKKKPTKKPVKKPKKEEDDSDIINPFDL